MVLLSGAKISQDTVNSMVKGLEERVEFPFLSVYSYLCIYPKTGHQRGSDSKVIEEITFMKISTMNNI